MGFNSGFKGLTVRYDGVLCVPVLTPSDRFCQIWWHVSLLEAFLLLQFIIW